MNPVEVRLSIDQARECARRAGLRKRTSRNADRDPSWSVVRTAEKEWEQEYGGQCGELAVELFYGLVGGGSVNTWQSGGDLVGGIEVRHAREHHKRLILRNDDRERVKPDAVYVFVTGLPPTLRIRGWITGREGLQVGVWEDPHGRRPALFVHPDQLHPPDQLKAGESL